MDLRNTKKSAWHTVSAIWELAFVYKDWRKPLLAVVLRHSCGVGGFMVPRKVSPSHTDYVRPLCGPGRRGDAQLPSPQV